MHTMCSPLIDKPPYLGFSANYPYRRSQASGQYGIGISVKAIVAALIFGAVVASIPIGLALVKLPGNMVAVANNSAVISAACHSRPMHVHGQKPPTPSKEAVNDKVENQPLDSHVPNDSSALLEASQSETDMPAESKTLYQMSIGKLKWGVVSPTKGTFEAPGRLAFGTEHHVTGLPVDGNWYA